jgi:hypothetical protein
LAWLTLLPVTGPLPHTVQTRAISSILLVGVSVMPVTPETCKSNQASRMRQPDETDA